LARSSTSQAQLHSTRQSSSFGDRRVIETERKTGFKSLDIATRRFASVAEHTS
jgi:hypothetical protein